MSIKKSNYIGVTLGLLVGVILLKIYYDKQNEYIELLKQNYQEYKISLNVSTNTNNDILSTKLVYVIEIFPVHNVSIDNVSNGVNAVDKKTIDFINKTFFDNFFDTNKYEGKPFLYMYTFTDEEIRKNTTDFNYVSKIISIRFDNIIRKIDTHLLRVHYQKQ